ncbi:MAG: hypothetical protein O3A00_08380 [Planctomycetota bacterium]|nr:hypothetical protein [Planctomycetota bacterium]
MSAPIPPEIEEVCQEHDRVCSDVSSQTATLLNQNHGSLNREETQEMATSVDLLVNDLRELLEQKENVNFFSGLEDSATHAKERAEHLRADHKKLLNDLKSISRELRTGKPAKARRQLVSWSSKFDDIVEREAKNIDELWNP